MAYYGSVNVGGGWGPPALDSGLLMYYDQQARRGLSNLAGMAGGALAGGLKVNPETRKRGGAKGALMGAAEEADPELKRRNQEFQSLQKYAEAAHGLPKEQTTPMGLDELRGVVRGYEYQAMQREKDEAQAIQRDRNDLERERQQSVASYYDRLARDREASTELEADRFDASQRWQAAYGQAFQSYGDPARAIAEANAIAPGGMPPGVGSDLLPQRAPASSGQMGPQAKADLDHISRLAMDAEKRLQDALADPKRMSDATLINKLRMNRDYLEQRRLDILGGGSQPASSAPSRQAEQERAAPAATAPKPSGVGKTITREIASQFLKLANGDRDKARQLARQAGYTF